ncbi:hypothetical protein C2E23DRAFT_465389 [Lenzites betulinus]|nr:hypothetical protein C2E23DRAFT_465389 [Lenzites betulinus]
MSSPDGPDVDEIVQQYNSKVVEGYIVVAVAVLLLYEYAITLDQEVRLFWKPQARGASVLFFFIRYWTLVDYVVLGLPSVFAHLSNSVCALFVKTQFAFTSLQYIPWGVLSALRVFALSGKNWVLSALVLLLSLGPAAVNLSLFGYGITGANDFPVGCNEEIFITQKQDIMLARATLIVADLILVVVTVVATWQRDVPFAIRRSNRLSLSNVLLYNGLMYFVVLLALNILVVVLGRVSNESAAKQASYITNISAPVTAIFICRFLLDLQAANVASAELGTQTLGSMQLDFSVFGASTRIDSLFGDGDVYWAEPGGGPSSADATIGGHEGEQEPWAGGTLLDSSSVALDRQGECEDLMKAFRMLTVDVTDVPLSVPRSSSTLRRSTENESGIA